MKHNDQRTHSTVRRLQVLVITASGFAALPAGAQPFTIDFWTVDAGGGKVTSATFTLTSTIAQPDTASMTGDTFAINGGFWCSTQRPGCYADCDSSGTLDFFDFLCFQNQFASGGTYADCDASGTLDFFDFLCFQNEFAGGCP